MGCDLAGNSLQARCDSKVEHGSIVSDRYDRSVVASLHVPFIPIERVFVQQVCCFLRSTRLVAGFRILPYPRIPFRWYNAACSHNHHHEEDKTFGRGSTLPQTESHRIRTITEKQKRAREDRLQRLPTWPNGNGNPGGAMGLINWQSVLTERPIKSVAKGLYCGLRVVPKHLIRAHDSPHGIVMEILYNAFILKRP